MFILIGSSQRLSTFGSSPSLIIDGAPVCQETFTNPSVFTMIEIYPGMFMSTSCVTRLLLALGRPATVRLLMRDLGLL